MKEIKAYVRIDIVNTVIDALEREGFSSMTIIDVSALGRLADPSQSKYSLEYVERYSRMARIELVCKDKSADHAVRIIQSSGCTHQHGDGIIFVLPVERAVKIRSNEEGNQILQTPSETT